MLGSDFRNHGFDKSKETLNQEELTWFHNMSKYWPLFSNFGVFQSQDKEIPSKNPQPSDHSTL